MTTFKAFLANESGSTAVEYGLIIALIAAVSIATIKSVGSNLALHWTRIENVIPTTVPGPGNAGSGTPTSGAAP
jgi:pilus assembly protein Flp/PilA